MTVRVDQAFEASHISLFYECTLAPPFVLTSNEAVLPDNL